MLAGSSLLVQGVVSGDVAAVRAAVAVQRRGAHWAGGLGAAVVVVVLLTELSAEVV